MGGFLLVLGTSPAGARHMTDLRIPTIVIATGLSLACGPTGPTPVPDSPGSPATGAWAPDTSAVTAGIVEELRALGVEAVIAERFGGEPFSAGMQRVAIPSLPNNSIYLYVYRTAALAADEASRITPGGQVQPVEGPPRALVFWAGTQHFYYRDRVIAQHAGCHDTITRAMRTLFGPPLVVTSRDNPCWEWPPS